MRELLHEALWMEQRLDEPVHVERLKRVFVVLNEREETEKSPALEAVLGDEIRVRHLKIATYGVLVLRARARGAPDEVVDLLQQSLDEEEYALEQAEHELAR